MFSPQASTRLRRQGVQLESPPPPIKAHHATGMKEHSFVESMGNAKADGERVILACGLSNYSVAIFHLANHVFF